MLNRSILQSIYQEQMADSSSFFDQVVHQDLNHQSLSFEEIITECKWQEPLFSEEKAIENWKQLLSINILCHLRHVECLAIKEKVHFFERHPWNQNSQYFRALIALNHAFSKMPIPEVNVNLLENGAALIDLKDYSPWLSLPFTPQHFEFGIFICLLALMTKREDLKEFGLQLANWQLNTLDINSKPFAGLFVRETDGKHLQHLCLNYLLFLSAATLKKETVFASIADNTSVSIQKYLKNHNETIHPLWVLIEKWLEQHQILSNLPLDLPEHIYDPSTALVGYRSAAQHVICTLHGGHTGLGTVRFEDVEIVNYGPQYLPLGDCHGFGIEGNALSDQGIRQSMIEWRPHFFSVKGCARLVDQPSISTRDREMFRGIWVEIIQEFKKPSFQLDASFLGLDGWDLVAFSFFVKASSCHFEEGASLLPKTLERFEGEAQTIKFEGEHASIKLSSPHFNGKMQVIPLAGGNNFWGADFLVAYLLSSDQRHYHWEISPFSYQDKNQILI